MRCGDCKHWGKYDPIHEVPDDNDWDNVNKFDLRQCGAVPHVDRSLDPPNDTVEGKRAIVLDGSGFYAALKTADDFGCVLFEPKGEA